MINQLNRENIELKNALQDKIVSFGEIIKPGFKFETVTKKENPKEYFAGAVLNKIYSLNISTENVLLSNDIFLAQYLYRYIYELYTKTFYIFSGSSDEEIVLRLRNFFNNNDLKITEYQDEIKSDLIPPKFKESHKEKYKTMSRFAHPNIESLNMHLGKNSDQQFSFLAPTINLILWHNIAIIKLFADLRLLNLDKTVDQEKLISLQSN
jgi:hypothetical protein